MERNGENEMCWWELVTTTRGITACNIGTALVLRTGDVGSATPRRSSVVVYRNDVTM